jgi:YVTN family beta-propeller protein
LNYTGQVGLGPHGNLPYAIALDNRSGQLFVTEQPSYLAVLSDSSSGPLAVATIFLGANTYPEGVVYDGDNNTVFVGTSTNQLLVISPDTLVIEKRILVDFEAETLAFDPVTGDVYAGGGLATFGLNGTDGDYNITVINGTTYAVSSIAASQGSALYPFAIAYDSIAKEIIAVGAAGLTGWNDAAAFNPTTGKELWYVSGRAGVTDWTSIAVDSENGNLYLPNCLTVSVLNATNGNITSEIGLPGAGTTCFTDGAAAYNPASSEILVGEDDGDVQAINASSATLPVPVDVYGLPGAIAVNATDGIAYVEDYDTASVAVLGLNDSTVLSVTNVGGTPNSIALDEATGTMYVAASDNVTLVNTTTDRVSESIPVGSNPNGIIYDPQSDEIFVANTDSSTVSVISTATNTLVANVSVDPTPWALAWDNASNIVYVTCMNFTGASTMLDMISATTLRVVRSISLGPSATTLPDGIAFVPPLNELFVDTSDPFVNEPQYMSVISAATNLTVGTIDLPSDSAPGQVVFDNATQELYIAGAGYAIDGNYSDVIVVNPFTQSVVGTIPVGVGPYGIAVEPGTTTLVATAGANDRVSLIDGANFTVSQILELPVNTYPEGVVIDASTEQVFTADWGNDSVSYFSLEETFPITFQESGLAAGTPWTASLGGMPERSTVSNLSFTLPNGTYGFSVTPELGYLLTPGSGSVTVSGVGQTLSIVFAKLYAVWFNATGLPNGTPWDARMGSTVHSNVTVGGAGSIKFVLPNGSYSYALQGLDGYHESAIPSIGNLTVDGANLAEQLEFEVVTYVVTFLESNLPAGTNWSVTLGGITNWSHESTVTFAEPNGTYQYEVGDVPGWHLVSFDRIGSERINGSAISNTMAWTATTYLVTLIEQGLPNGATWSATVEGLSSSSSTNSITTAEPNGTYSFSVGSIEGRIAAPTSGKLAVSGGPVSLTINFQSNAQGSASFLGLPAIEGYAVFTGVLAFVGAGMILLLLRWRKPGIPSRDVTGPRIGRPPMDP